MAAAGSSGDGQRASPSDPVGTGEVAVEQSPLRTTFVRSHSRFVLSWPDDSALEIKYHRGVRVVAWVLCILGWPVLLLGLLGLIGQPDEAGSGRASSAVGLLLLWGGVVCPDGGLAAGAALSVRRLGRLVDGPALLAKRAAGPWRRSRAVQMIDAGWFGTKFMRASTATVPSSF